jgi:hypothetical protein
MSTNALVARHAHTGNVKVQTQDKESIRQLVIDATAVDAAKRSNHQLPTARQLQAIKAIGKRSNENIRAIFEAIMERLSSGSCHVRVCAMEIYQVLFERSSVFRRLGCDRLDKLMQRTITGKLPGPDTYEKELRSISVRLLRRWSCEYGMAQPKLGLACRHLHGLGFIEGESTSVSNPPEDDYDGRSHVSSEMERAVEEFASCAAQWRILVKELENARIVLESTGKSNLTKKDTIQLKEQDSDEEWEEVGEEGDLTDDVYVPLLESYREASSETIPKLQNIINACREMYTSGFDSRVSNTIQEAVELNASLVTACAAYERKLGNTIRQKQGLNRSAGQGAKSDTARQQEEDERESPMDRVPTMKPDPAKSCTSVNPMLLIRDPTMPKKRLSTSGGLKSGCDKVERQNNLKNKSKSSVLARLAEVAPVVPVGGFAGVWDSNAPAVYGQTMEVANHWGPVDVTKELPKDRLDALFLIDQSKIKYNSPAGDPTKTKNMGKGDAVPLRCKEIEQKSPNHHIPSSRLTDRKEERRFNEQMLRDANVAAGFGFIRQSGPSQSSARESRISRGGRTLSVNERLSKKLKIRR